MPRDTDGVYTLPTPNTFNPAIAGTPIEPADWNDIADDLVAELNDNVPFLITTMAELQAAATAGGRWRCASVATTAKISVTGDNFELIGDHMFTSAITCSDVDAPVFEIANDIDVVFENLTITHTGTPIAGGDGIAFLGITQLSRLERLYVINNYVGLNLGPASYGIIRGCVAVSNILRNIAISATAASSSLQWHIRDTLSENVVTAGGANYYVTSVGGSPGNATMGTWVGANSFGGAGYGIHLVGDATHGIFGFRLVGGFLGAEATACIRFQNTYGSSHQIASSYLEQVAAGSGIIADANCLSLYVSDTVIAQMGVSGIVSAAPVLSVVGGEIASNTSIGIDITAAARVLINGVDVRSNGTGIRFGAFAINATISGNNVSSNSTQFTNGQVGGTVIARGNTGIADTDLTVSLSDNGAGQGPFVTTDRVSTTPAANDQIGVFYFNGRDSGGNAENYAGLGGLIVDPTLGSEDGMILFQTVVAGAFANRALLAQGLQMGAPTGGDLGGGTINVATSYSVNNVLVPTISSTDALSNKTLTAPKIVSGGFLADANGNELIIFTTTASAVNEFTITNKGTGAYPVLSVSGGDTNIGMNFQIKGAGVYNLLASATASTELRFYEATGSGTNFIALLAPGAIGTNSTLTLPETDGVVAVTKNLGIIRYVVTGVNFNSANTDNAVTITLPTGISRYAITRVMLSNASASISTATVGVFTSTGGGGVTIAANQAITVTASAVDTNNNMQSLTITNANTEAYNDATLQVRVGTAQGSAATADVIIDIYPLS